MDPIQFWFYLVLLGVFASFFLVKGVLGLATGRFVTMTGLAAAWSLVDYLSARGWIRKKGDDFYDEKTGRAARVWSVIYTTIGLAFVGGIAALCLSYLT